MENEIKLIKLKGQPGYDSRKKKTNGAEFCKLKYCTAEFECLEYQKFLKVITFCRFYWHTSVRGHRRRLCIGETRFMEAKARMSIRPERSRNHKSKHDVTPLIFLSLSASADCHSHSCYLGCGGRCIGLSYLGSLSLFIWPVLSLVLSNAPSSPTTLADV